MSDQKPVETTVPSPEDPVPEKVEEVVIPPTPIVPTRPSLLHVSTGNISIILLLIAFATGWLPGWSVLLLSVVLLLLGAWDSEHRDRVMTDRFSAQRLNEIASLFETEEAAGAQLREDIKRGLHLSKAIDTIAVPMLLTTIIAGFLAYREVSGLMQSLPLLIRLVPSLVGAIIVSFIFFGLWAVANLTTAVLPIDYERLRSEQDNTHRLEAHDQNDISIIRQIAGLENLHKRVETYTLESALLSALSFSSFFAIALSERDYIGMMRNLNVPQLMWYPLAGNGGASIVPGIPYVPLSFFLANLIALIGLCLLFCASTFLGVLIARLRFNDGYRDADCMLRAAERINEKEEKAIDSNEEGKADLYARAVDNLLRQAGDLQDGLALTMIHMRVSRNTGIVFFVLALVLCGLLFNSLTAILVSMIFLGSMLLGYIDRFARSFLRNAIFSGGLASHLNPFRTNDK